MKKKSFISKNQTNYNGLEDFYSDVLNAYKPMSAADERHMWKLVKQGNEYARERIINSNLRWVIKEANRYSALSGVQSEDLIGEGFYALSMPLCKLPVIMTLREAQNSSVSPPITSEELFQT